MSRGTWETQTGSQRAFAYRTFTFCGPTFPDGSTSVLVCNSPASYGPSEIPRPRRNASGLLDRFRLFRVSLAATQGIAVAFSSWGY